MEMHRNGRSLESSFLPLWPTQPLGLRAQAPGGVLFPNRRGCLWQGVSHRPTSLLCCRCWKEKAAIPSPHPGGEGRKVLPGAWASVHMCMCMCGPWSEGRAGASLQNSIKKKEKEKEKTETFSTEKQNYCPWNSYPAREVCGRPPLLFIS